MPYLTPTDIPEIFQLSPEFRLLVACSWVAPPMLEQDQSEKIASLCRGGIDWDVFVSLVRRHGVSALAHSMLCRNAGNWVPEIKKELLKTQHLQMSVKSLQQLAELIRINTLFSAQGIQMIPLKGVLLSHLLYGNSAMRDSLDIDILVKPEDVDRSDILLKSEGYQCEYPGVELTQQQKTHLQHHIHHYEYKHVEYGFNLELHCRSFLWTVEQTEELWKNNQVTDLHGSQFINLSDNSLLLYLCEHGARHNWFRLKWLSDVAMLFSRERQDNWSSIIELAGRLDLTRVLALSAQLVHLLYGIRLSDPLCQLISKERNLTNLSASAIKTLNSKTRNSTEACGMQMERLKEAWHIMKLKPSLPFGLMVKEVLIVPEDFIVLSLPGKLFWLYVLLRPFLWIWRNIINRKI